VSLREEIRAQFLPLFAGTGGIDSWLTDSTPDDVFDRLARLGSEPLTRVQLNQLLVLSHEAGASDGFFSYYWSEAPAGHPYDVTAYEYFEDGWKGLPTIASLNHLRWGLTRFYTDALLFYGNVRFAYRQLRDLDREKLYEFFSSRRIDTEALSKRGVPLAMEPISKDNRYLISEMACKSLEAGPKGGADLVAAIQGAYGDRVAKGGGAVAVKELLDGSYVKERYAGRELEFAFSADALLDSVVGSQRELDALLGRLSTTFDQARRAALRNTRLYLSMVGDLDVYVATSMRNRQDFRTMADSCERVFNDPRLTPLQLRYFDPTMSAAEGHEDKGLIECLMVKATRALLYFAGARESYGKDVEAAMALSQGKPVIFVCDEGERQRFYRDVHPLSRLTQYETGVPVGAIVAVGLDVVVELLARIFENRMEYDILQPRPGYFRLVERLTDSVVRLQTNDELLRETFWNHYHRTPPS
jgi:hypothetical protein